MRYLLFLLYALVAWFVWQLGRVRRRNMHDLIELIKSEEYQNYCRNLKPPPRVYWDCEGCKEYTWQGPEPPACCPNCGHTHFGKRVEDAA